MLARAVMHVANSRELPAVQARWRVTARAVQVALGLIWIFDAALQYQPAMFGKAFVTQMILPNAQNQPAPVAWSIRSLGHLLLPHVGMWNLTFASVQLAIGVGLLFPRWVRPALVAMFAWCFGVWWFGEGFGQLLTGSSMPLSGAPGAVTLYCAIGVLVWPRRSASNADAPLEVEGSRGTGAVGVASSAAAQGPFGTSAALAVWSGFWTLSAVLWLLPANRAPDAARDVVGGMANGQPAWYGHLLATAAGHLAGIGGGVAWALALLSLVIGLGPLLTSRPNPFLACGVAVELVFWVTGMGLGGIMTGMGTDPNAAPLVLLLALAMVPRLPASRPLVQTPLAGWVRGSPIPAAIGAATILVAIVVSASYPVAASSASDSAAAPGTAAPGATASGGGSAMPGMPGMPRAPGAAKAKTTSLSLPTESPAGAITWPEPMETMMSGMQMVTPNCTAEPTRAQQLAAVRLVNQTAAAAAQYKSLAVAKAAGYVPVTPAGQKVVHYINYAVLRNQTDALDPSAVPVLVYVNTTHGAVLAAAMYLVGPKTVDQTPPQPGGCLTEWHIHENLCFSGTSVVGLANQGTCAAGAANRVTEPMMHVWLDPVPGGPLSPDPDPVSEVLAAYRLQPSTPSNGTA